jgi:hypothetical protein
MRAHSGWAVVLGVSGKSAILRRRIGIEGPDVPKQPFHAAAAMDGAEASAFIRRAEQSAVTIAAAAIGRIIEDLRAAGYEAHDAAVLLGSGKPLPELPRILAAHPLIHTAEGVFFRQVLLSACRSCGLAVTGIPERELLPKVSAPGIAAMGKSVGAPWTQDEKLSAAAALKVL